MISPCEGRESNPHTIGTRSLVFVPPRNHSGNGHFPFPAFRNRREIIRNAGERLSAELA